MNIEELISKKLNLPLEDIKKNSRRLEEYNATYYWNPIRGGISIIVNDNGDYLAATSSVNFEKHLETYLNGNQNKNIFKEN